MNPEIKKEVEMKKKKEINEEIKKEIKKEIKEEIKEEIKTGTNAGNKTIQMACITCPMSCHLTVTLDAEGAVCSVSGNTCKRGENYARNELTHPMRMLTSTVKIENGMYRRLPVILSEQIPKERLFDVMREISHVSVCAPIQINDIIIENVCGLGVNVIASRSMSL